MKSDENSLVPETWKLELQIVRTSRQEFISKLSRGDYLKPSDVVYITCIHVFVFYRSIKNNTDAFEFLENSTDPRSVFTKSFVDIK